MTLGAAALPSDAPEPAAGAVHPQPPPAAATDPACGRATKPQSPVATARAATSNGGRPRLSAERKQHTRWTAEELAEVAALANKIGVGHAAARIGYHEHTLRMTFTRHGYRRQWVKV